MTGLEIVGTVLKPVYYVFQIVRGLLTVFRRGVWTPIGAGVTIPTLIKSRL